MHGSTYTVELEPRTGRLLSFTRLQEQGVETPAPESGITIEDVRDVVRRLREALKRFQELAYVVEDVPAVYDPEKEPETSAGGKTIKYAIFYPVEFILFPEIELGPRVTRADKVKALAAIETLYNEAADRLNSRLKAGEITVDVWLQEMQSEISSGHVSAYSAGRSGAWSSITFSEWGRLGSRIKKQFQHLKGFAGEIRKKGVDAFTFEKLKFRTGLYGSNMRESLEAGHMRDRGIDPSILPAIPGDGTTKCLVRCKCRWTVRAAGRDKFKISWRLGAAEHCRTCLDRARDWVGLDVVKGRLVSQVVPHYHNHN